MTYLKGNVNIKDVAKSQSATFSSNNLTFTNSNIKSDEKPWMKYYVTADEFFEVMRVAYEDTYGGSDTPWHPEDLYVNISCVLEIVANTLSNMASLKSGRPLKGVKEV